MNTTYRNLLLLIFNTVLIFSVHAEEKSVVKLSDGSTLTGKIIVQRPGKDISITAETASFVIDDIHILSIDKKKVKYESLSREWKRWALIKKKLQGDADGRFLILCDIKTKKYTLTNVVKVENAEEPKVVYTSVVKDNYTINWKDIKSIRKVSIAKDNKPCVKDEVTTNSGDTYEGNIVSQQPGSSLTIKTGTSIVKLKSSEIAEIRKIASSKDFKVQELADYTNTVVLKDGTTKTGIMTVQHYGKKAKDQYITMLYNNGERENIQTNEITEYRTSYQNVEEDNYKENYVYVNEFHIKSATTKKEGDNVFYTDRRVFPFPEGIEITFKTLGSKFQESWKLIALENLKMSNGSFTQGYTSTTLKSNSIKPSVTDLVNNVSSISFTYLSPGFYALVNTNKPETYIIKIVK